MKEEEVKKGTATKKDPSHVSACLTSDDAGTQRLILTFRQVFPGESVPVLQRQNTILWIQSRTPNCGQELTQGQFNQSFDKLPDRTIASRIPWPAWPNWKTHFSKLCF